MTDRTILRGALLGLSLLLTASCTVPEGVSVEQAQGSDAPNDARDRLRERYGTILGDPTGEYLIASTRPQAEEEDGGTSGIGVNSFLWRASLDTLSFLPLGNADPFGGIINYDWYAPPEAPDERFKVTVYITDTRLRADALNVAVLRETRSGDQWQSASVEGPVPRELEDKILTRARELRVAAG